MSMEYFPGGKIIAFEGLDNCFKETNARAFAEKLAATFPFGRIEYESFPRYNDWSSALLKKWLNGDFDRDLLKQCPEVIKSFFTIDRVAYWNSKVFSSEFGYITNMLLTRVYDENVTNFEEATEAIVRINDIFGDVFKIHSTAGFLNTIRVERQAVIDTLAEKSFNECQEILTDLFARKLPSREDNVQCLVSKEGCKRIDLKSCFECQYHIPSIYALTMLCESMIEDMKNYHNVKGAKKYKLALSIDRKSILLKEAMDILTPEYVYNCLGLTRDEFKSQLKLIDMPEDFLEDKELLER